MKKCFFISFALASMWTVCAMACPDPAFYRPAEGQLDEDNMIECAKGKIYVKDDDGWFTVDSIYSDQRGVFYVINANYGKNPKPIR